MANVFDLDGRGTAVWTGASNLALLPIFKSKWISKDDYEENGSEIIHRKHALMNY